MPSIANNITNKINRIVLKRLYSRDEVIVMELTHPAICHSPAGVIKVNGKNVTDALSFQSQRQVKQFIQFLSKGYEGYYAYIDQRCVHRSWVVKNPEEVLIHKFYSLKLKPDEVFIQFCETASEARGKNIFPHVLSTIGHEFNSKRVLTSVASNNIESYRSMIKAGFSAVDRFQIRMVLGIKHVISIKP